MSDETPRANGPPTEDGGKRSGVGKAVRLGVGIAISALSLVAVLWNIEWERFWASLQGADYWWLIPSIATVGAAVWFKVMKWQWLLLPTRKTSQANLFYSMSVGYLVNTVLPGRLGELARTLMVARLERVSPVAVLSTVAVDRILDVVAVALLLAAVLPTANLPSWVGQSGLMVGVGGVALLVLCLVMAYPTGQALFTRLLKASPRFPGKTLIEGWIEALYLGVQGLRGGESQARIALSTAGVWLVSIFTFYFAQLAFHIQAPLWAGILVLAMTNLGMVVPSSPGYIGVYHYLVVLAMGAYGVEKEVALGYAVVVHLVGLLPVALAGAYSLWRCGLTLMGWRDGEERKAESDSRVGGVGARRGR